jgi:hypothetical protein
VFARDLRLRLLREHLDRPDGASVDDLLDPGSAFSELTRSAEALQRWYDGGRRGPKPAGRLRPHVPEVLPRRHRPWAVPVYRFVYDPDGRAIRDRVRRRP